MNVINDMYYFLLLWSLYIVCDTHLYPRESETREVISLDGIWKFRLSIPVDEENFLLIPVPSSYNDITVSRDIRDHVGWVWYERSFFPPWQWKHRNLHVFIRFGSIEHTSNVFVNGHLAGTHIGGHLPFEVDVSRLLLYGSRNVLSVSVNNTLTQDTIPQGSVEHANDTDNYPEGYMKYSLNCDYFNYAGIHRSVYLHAVPWYYIKDITVRTVVNGTTGIIMFEINHNMNEDNLTILVEIFDASGGKVAECYGLCGMITIPDASFWWPYLSHPAPGYLYTLQVSLVVDSVLMDTYRLPIGIRHLRWNSSHLILNDRPVYLHGFGKHEDASIRGRGVDNSILLRDYQLMMWIGANVYRTSHYPYSEESLMLADKYGIMIIDESPACGLNNFHDRLLQKHKLVMEEIIKRDKNHPSVIMWSLANEPHTEKNESTEYFRSLVDFARTLDTSRPVTFVTSQQVETDKAVQFVDIICVNRYRAWYTDPGRLELIPLQVREELTAWYKCYDKPVLVTEYGAGSLSGLHSLPPAMWTEDYQVLLLEQHFKTFDALRSQGFLLGEMIWNFQDFLTPQEVIRPGACVKGLFTRDRQPKAAAYIVKKRFWSLAHNITRMDLSSDLSC